jgi:hypothetical protein
VFNLVALDALLLINHEELRRSRLATERSHTRVSTTIQYCSSLGDVLDALPVVL